MILYDYTALTNLIDAAKECDRLRDLVEKDMRANNRPTDRPLCDEFEKAADEVVRLARVLIETHKEPPA